MKKLQIATIVLFFALLAVPLITFSRGDNIVSEIDNRVLANNPFGKNADIGARGYPGAIEDYISDRIGFRSEMIRFYTRMNDKLFGIMVHPIYTYGKDGYVFIRNVGDGPVCGDYQKFFAQMVVRTYRYCRDRDIPFLFVFEPVKNAVLRDKLSDGIIFNNGWKTEFFQILKGNGVPYIDNTDLLIEKTAEGEAVFNRKYNAGHWNDLGAFYGVNHILSALQPDFPVLEQNRPDEFTVEQVLRKSLQISEFLIEDYDPVYTMNGTVNDITEVYDEEVKRDSNFRHFRYTINEEQREKGAPRALVFEGSYMIGMGYKFLDNRLGEYIAVHDYQNILNLDYYYNLFQPECVIFEVAEYTFANLYFDSGNMAKLDLNPALRLFDDLTEQKQVLQADQVQIASGLAVTNITVTSLPADTKYAYLIMNGIVYDLHRGNDEYTLSVINNAMGDFSIVTVDTEANIKNVFTM